MKHSARMRMPQRAGRAHRQSQETAGRDGSVRREVNQRAAAILAHENRALG